MPRLAGVKIVAMRASGPALVEEWIDQGGNRPLRWGNSDPRASLQPNEAIDLSRHPEGVDEIAAFYGVDMGGPPSIYTPNDGMRFLVALLAVYGRDHSRMWAEPIEAA